jgi:hypothetical protein
MSLFEDASLIVTPNAQKAGKLYAIKPDSGAGDLTVTRATEATRVNSAGLIEVVANNVPRLDYTNGSCPSILVEPQRTNLVLYSEQFDNASWQKAIGSFITPNTLESPSDTLTADLLSGVNFNTGQNVSVLAGTYTFSVYVKSQGLDIGKEIAVRFQNSPFPQTNITTDGNWQRISVTITVTSTTTLSPRVLIFGLTNPVSQIYIWGAQLEVGSNATSYIPTVASAVTRNADVISKTGLTGITTITETFENGTTNVISGSPTSYTMSQGRIKQVIGI